MMETKSNWKFFEMELYLGKHHLPPEQWSLLFMFTKRFGKIHDFSVIAEISASFVSRATDESWNIHQLELVAHEWFRCSLELVLC